MITVTHFDDFMTQRSPKSGKIENIAYHCDIFREFYDTVVYNINKIWT